MPIRIGFETLIEDQPAERWKALFERFWPGYRSWYLRSGAVGRPSFLDCRRALRKHMPELVPTWQRLVELAGGGDVEARFLSLWCPPPYIAGCSQAVWHDSSGHEEPVLELLHQFTKRRLVIRTNTKHEPDVRVSQRHHRAGSAGHGARVPA